MNKYYGDHTRWFVADVVDASPPYGYEGRVRIRVHGVHNPATRAIAQNDLPWAQCVIPTTEGGVSGIGFSPSLQSGALVFGFFMDGKESQTPIVVGSLPRTEFPTPVQKSVAYDDLLEKTKVQEDFYNQSISGIDEDDSALYNDLRDETPTGKTTLFRRDVAVKFFLNNGYTIRQACALVGVMESINSAFDTTFENAGGLGLMGWSDIRFTRLKAFSNTWWHFSTQLSFILFELNSSHIDANIRILNSDVIDQNKGKALGGIIGRHYAPIRGDYNADALRIFELYSNKKV